MYTLFARGVCVRGNSFVDGYDYVISGYYPDKQLRIN